MWIKMVKKSPIQTSNHLEQVKMNHLSVYKRSTMRYGEQKSGSVMEMINGTKMLVFYEPVQFHSTTWAVLLLKPV
jgi:hypothetical protein